MAERYHLVLALTSLAVGVVVAVGDRLVPRLRSRSLALAGLAGAVWGGWGSPRWWPWLAVAALLVVATDQEEPAHPLGRIVPLLTVASLVGAWAAVPDTEPPLAALASLFPLAALRAARGPRTGITGTAALVVAVVGAAWVGSAGWGAALATVCAVGAVAVAPLVTRFGPGLRGRAAAAVVAVHLLVALVMPRLIMGRPVGVAWAVAVASLLLVAAVVALADRWADST